MSAPIVTQAMILAAGCGERMRPLSDKIPKPLLRVGGKALAEWHLLALAKAGVRQAVINHGRLGALIERALGDGRRYGLRLRYSAEGDDPLETAGGVVKALPLLNEAPFFLVNADVWVDLDFAELRLPEGFLAHLILVDNPPHHPQGDFSLDGGRVLGRRANGNLTYGGIGVYCPGFFADLPVGRRPLAPLLRAAAQGGRISGERLEGRWLDVGTPGRLAEANRIHEAARQGT